MKLGCWLFVALCMGVLLGIYSTLPPTPLGKDVAASHFSTERAMDDIKTVAAKPHPTGSAENVKVQAYLLKRMAELGMETQSDPSALHADALAQLNGWSGRNDSNVNLTNLIGILPGRDRNLPAIMLMSHHDTVWGSPGASDDTTGVAVSLEVVRAVKAWGRAERDLIVLMTDAEEIGLWGAKHFFANNPLRNRVGAIINLEARGGGGRASMFQTSRENGAAMALYADNVRRPAASSLAAYIYSVLPNNTDLTPALKGDYTAYNIAFIGRSGLYHSPHNTADKLDLGSVQDMGDQTLDLSKALLKKDSLPEKVADTVFFDVLGVTLVHYPAWVGWAFLGVTFITFAIALRREGTNGIGAGLIRFVLVFLVAGLLIFALNWLTLGGGQGEYYDRLAAIPRLEAVVALVCLATFAAIIGPWRPTAGAMAGFALPLLLLAVAGQVYAPTAIYFVALPVMLVALVLVIPAGLPRMLAGAVVCIVVIAYMLGLGHFIMQGVGPDSPYVAVLPFGLAILAVLPLWQAMGERNARLVAGSAITIALGLSLWVLLDAPADTVAVYAES